MVNGALEYLAKDLGIAENTVLQGKMKLIVIQNISSYLVLVVCAYCSIKTYEVDNALAKAGCLFFNNRKRKSVN